MIIDVNVTKTSREMFDVISLQEAEKFSDGDIDWETFIDELEQLKTNDPEKFEEDKLSKDDVWWFIMEDIVCNRTQERLTTIFPEYFSTKGIN